MLEVLSRKVTNSYRNFSLCCCKGPILIPTIHEQGRYHSFQNISSAKGGESNNYRFAGRENSPSVTNEEKLSFCHVELQSCARSSSFSFLLFPSPKELSMCRRYLDCCSVPSVVFVLPATAMIHLCILLCNITNVAIYICKETFPVCLLCRS